MSERHENREGFWENYRIYHDERERGCRCEECKYEDAVKEIMTDEEEEAFWEGIMCSDE